MLGCLHCMHWRRNNFPPRHWSCHDQTIIFEVVGDLWFWHCYSGMTMSSTFDNGMGNSSFMYNHVLFELLPSLGPYFVIEFKFINSKNCGYEMLFNFCTVEISKFELT
jgi:hypothetical protein